MSNFTLLRKFLLFLTLAVFAVNAETQAQNTPIYCNGKFLVSHGDAESSTSATSIKQLSFTGSNVNPAAFVTAPNTIGFNAIGINPADGYMYAVRYPVTGAKPKLVKIGSGGTNVNDIGEIGGTNNNEKSYAGCFDADGIFYFTTNDDRLMKISSPIVNNPTAYIVGSTNAIFADFADIAVDPTDGQMYGTTNSTNKRLYKINKSTGALTLVGAYGSGNNSIFMAGLFFTENGTLYGYRSDGGFYSINKSTAAITATGTGPTYQLADGCSCSFRLAHELTVPNAICPTTANPNPTFDITVKMQNSSNIAQSGLTYGFTIPSNRFSITETPTVIAQRLFNLGLLPSNSASQVTLSNSGVSPVSVLNKITITSLKSPFVYGDVDNNLKTFTIKLKLVTTGGTYTPISIQSKISNLPAGIGTEDLSNDPNTASPDDATVINFCSNITLPVDLTAFSGSYRNGSSLLNWETANEVNFDHFEIERSTDNSYYTAIGAVASQHATTTAKYQYTDDLSSQSGSIFFYRLKMVDIDGNYKYSNTIMIRKDVNAVSGITVSPNPVISGGIATIRVKSDTKKSVEIRVTDAAGRVVLKQQNQLVQGVNSISFNNSLNRIQSGIYTIQVISDDEILSTRLSVVR
ncbi:MAG: T9SS type A sorting domain-containing protein [Chitinophagaceae bacterium]